MLKKYIEGIGHKFQSLHQPYLEGSHIDISQSNRMHILPRRKESKLRRSYHQIMFPIRPFRFFQIPANLGKPRLARAYYKEALSGKPFTQEYSRLLRKPGRPRFSQIPKILKQNGILRNPELFHFSPNFGKLKVRFSQISKKLKKSKIK